jgi:hypothetical protein
MSEPSRDAQFVNYYCLSVYTMRISKFCLQMAQSFSQRRDIKNALRLAENSMDCRLAEITMKLKRESYSDIMEDLRSEDLQAIGSILHELVQLPSVLDAEDALMEFIKQLKQVQNGRLAEIPGEPKKVGQDPGL